LRVGIATPRVADGMDFHIQNPLLVVNRFLLDMLVNNDQAVVFLIGYVQNRPEKCRQYIHVALVAEDEIKDKISCNGQQQEFLVHTSNT